MMEEKIVLMLLRWTTLYFFSTVFKTLEAGVVSVLRT